MQVRDITVLAAVISIVAMLVIPLPHWLISFLIIINITIALLILMTAMNMKEALEFSVFPTIVITRNIVSTWLEMFPQREQF